MNKNGKIKKEINQRKLKETYKEEYSYDFVPALNEWTNIDEQRKRAIELENITDKKE